MADGISPVPASIPSAEHSPLPWFIHAEPVANREQALEELTYQLDHTKELASHLYLLNADGLCPGLTGCGPKSEANAIFIMHAVNNYYSLLQCARMLAGLESEDGGRSFPTKQACAFARAAAANAEGR